MTSIHHAEAVFLPAAMAEMLRTGALYKSSSAVSKQRLPELRYLLPRSGPPASLAKVNSEMLKNAT
jgi:hypothetical protein